MAESRAAPGPDTPVLSRLTRRGFLKAGGALVVGLTVAGARRAAAQAASSGAPAAPRPAWPTDRYLGKPVAPDQVDSFLAIHADGTITLFTGKVDIGTGGRAIGRNGLAGRPVFGVGLGGGESVLRVRKT